ncbi:YvrJ family protein [Fictibacillus sp. 23RED33]|uniref:YvrJ family protein n=1 Tax=Fictibacillus sp. 23RED33 TaxID=2745879 RepID=UPI0018CCBC11|nr:YvrJ family protein [Fictibacillus sp. 23RED33]MBH0176240.1 YvrJ family protein [Fictibacillus sp. 23RED33]
MEPIAEQFFLQIIGNVGFPIAITVYLLHRFEKRIELLQEAINSLSEVVRNSKKE